MIRVIVKTFFVLLAVVGLMVVYFAPFLVVDQMLTSISKGDPVGMSECIDYPRLRENIKIRINKEIGRNIVESGEDNPFAQIGGLFAAAVIGPAVDYFVSPQNIALMMSGKKSDSDKVSEYENGIDNDMQYESINKFVVTVKKKGSSGQPVILVMNREGVFDWKLVDIVVGFDKK
jgi:hypothetical protein